MKFTLDELRKMMQDNPELQVDGLSRDPPLSSGAAAPKEIDDQIAVVRWAHGEGAQQYPVLGLLHHIPNGEYRPKGTGGRLRGAGVLSGMPDLFLPCACALIDGTQAHGLYIELKRVDRSNHPGPMQKVRIEQLRAQGYAVVVCYGREEAMRAIKDYLSSHMRREVAFGI